MRSTILAATIGVVTVLAFPPYGQAWIMVPALAALFWLLRVTTSPGHAMMIGGAFGLGFFGFLFPWIGQLGLVAFLPLWLTETFFTAMFGLGISFASRRSFPVWVISAVGGWALMEWLRSRLPVGGFAWGLVGLPVGEYQALRPLTAWVGISGWSVLVTLISAVTVWVVVDRSRQSIAVFLGVSAVTAIAVFAAGATFEPASGTPVRVAVVQGGWPCPGLHCPSERQLAFESHLDLTRTLAPGSVDLVVWAESSLGFDSDPLNNPEIAETITAEASRLNSTILAGTDRPVGDDGFINANVVFAPNGTLVGEYRKTHPVPFGEYIPLRQLFDWIPALDQVPRDLVRGEGPVRFDTGFGSFGSVISFEASFARYPRRAISGGADLLVVATSQNSYPHSRASDQLIGITRMHAAALGVDVVHAAITGRSAIIYSGGEIASQTELVERTILEGTVHMNDGRLTLYALVGDWLQVTAVFAMTLIALRRLQQLDF